MTHGPVRWNGDMRANLFQSSGLWWYVIRIEGGKKKRLSWLSWLSWLSENGGPIFLWPDPRKFSHPFFTLLVFIDRGPGPGCIYIQEDYFCFIVDSLGCLRLFSFLTCCVFSTGWNCQLGDRRVMKEATVKAWIKDINSQQARQVVDSANEQGIQIYNCRQYFFGPLGLMSAVLYIYRKSEYWFFRFTVLDGNDFPHIAMGEKTEKIYFSLLQACFLIAHSSGVFYYSGIPKETPELKFRLFFFFITHA